MYTGAAIGKPSVEIIAFFSLLFSIEIWKKVSKRRLRKKQGWPHP
jgi:hypothetical protein